MGRNGKLVFSLESLRTGRYEGVRGRWKKKEKEIRSYRKGKHNLKLNYRGKHKTFHSSTFLENKKHKTIQ